MFQKSLFPPVRISVTKKDLKHKNSLVRNFSELKVFSFNKEQAENTLIWLFLRLSFNTLSYYTCNHKIILNRENANQYRTLTIITIFNYLHILLWDCGTDLVPNEFCLLYYLKKDSIF